MTVHRDSRQIYNSLLLIDPQTSMSTPLFRKTPCSYSLSITYFSLALDVQIDLIFLRSCSSLTLDDLPILSSVSYLESKSISMVGHRRAVAPFDALQPLPPYTNQPQRHRLSTFTYLCQFCSAKHFLEERTSATGSSLRHPVFSNCCHRGKVLLHHRDIVPQPLHAFFIDYPYDDRKSLSSCF